MLRNVDLDRVPTLGLGRYSGWARLADVYDGDTITVVAPLASEMFKVRVRLSGVDTPELCGVTKTAGLAARDALIAHLAGIDMCGLGGSMVRHMLKTSSCLVWIVCKGNDKYGRALCKVYTEAQAITGRLASTQDFLIGAGYAVAYDGGRKPTVSENSKSIFQWMTGK